MLRGIRVIRCGWLNLHCAVSLREMEKLISPRNINPFPYISGYGSQTVNLLSKTFNFRKFPQKPFQFSLGTRRSFSLGSRNAQCGTFCLLQVEGPSGIELSGADATISGEPFTANGAANLLAISAQDMRRIVLVDLDPSTAKLAIGFLGPFLSAFGFLFILRIVMSWYPILPVEKFPYVIAYAPTEPLLAQTRKLIPPVGGVDVTPVVWFGLISFLNEILVGPQGLLVLLSQQV
ncbi:ylmG homolog protein 1-1, chloroplastic [Diospyros lotus]|uniref:ylmG homolog protein 1-1, chloroplastic n=1 Tax=Diospyros lotus TaxID=55363 RepID=UPI0022580031|nr:ylmG homolog protein 1-1, chloroplastic [Diospyros lotus]